MVIVLTVLFVVSAVLLALLVLIQDDQGEGIGGMFGGGSTSAFGSRSGNVLTRATTILAAVFLVSALGVAWLNKSPATDDIEARARVRRLEETQGDWYAPTRSDEATSEQEPAIEAASGDNATEASPQPQTGAAEDTSEQTTSGAASP
jgi:preprotein translocase subunit SecG